MLINNSHQDRSPIVIQSNISLHDKNWFKTGGAARFFIEPSDAYSFQYALNFAQQHKLAIFMLGSGANILISDDGFDGLVIRPQLNNITIIFETDSEVHVQAGAGVTMPDLINWCLDHGILGLEEFSGIPGTVGGSVFINLHYFEFLLSQFLISAEIINTETHLISSVDNAWFNFGYNTSALHHNKHYLVNATFKLKKGNAEQIAYARGRHKEIIRHRAQRYPQSGTCGSFFRNFYPHEVTLEQHGKKIIWVAYYLDKIGVKGSLRIGNAAVSYQHANMIVNLGNATSQDIISVAQQMQQLVYNQFGILSQPECRLIGFDKDPL